MKNKIGIIVCECGPNIAGRVDIERTMNELSSLKGFEDSEITVKKHKLLCSNEGKQFLEEELKSEGFTHLVIGACSPREHDKTFTGVCKKAGFNPFMYNLVNIREQCAWVIPDKEEATDKAVQFIKGGVNRVLYQEELFEKQVESNPDVLIIGGGIAGVEAALNLASKQRKVYLIDIASELGGKTTHLHGLLTEQGSNLNLINQKLSKLRKNPNIKVFTNTRLDNIIGFMGNYEIVLKDQGTGAETELVIGAVIVATGYDLKPAQDSGYMKFSDENDVHCGLEIEALMAKDKKILKKNGKAPSSIGMIHCVGREQVGYCSKICCNYLLKISGDLKKMYPDIKIKHYVKDLCLPDKDNDSYCRELKEEGIGFQYINSLELNGEDVSYSDKFGNKGSCSHDMIVYAKALIPSTGTKNLSDLMNVELDEFGFYKEAHLKIDPLSSSGDGIFVVGSAHGPSNVVDSIVQAKAAVAKIKTQLIPGQKIIPEVKVSEVVEAYCTGCQTCLKICKYGAIYFDEIKAVSVVNEAVCRGCGNCVGSCPSGSIRSKHFTNPQILQEIKEVVR